MKYRVLVTREITESGFITVEADSEEEAEELAVESHLQVVNYETDMYIGDVYATSVEESPCG